MYKAKTRNHHETGRVLEFLEPCQKNIGANIGSYYCVECPFFEQKYVNSKGDTYIECSKIEEALGKPKQEKPQREVILDVLNALKKEYEDEIFKLKVDTLFGKKENKRFTPPYRVGRKQKRTVLDSNGCQVVIFPKGQELMAQEYCDFLNDCKTITVP